MKEQIIERIPIAQIHIANPRTRSRGRWQMMVANIREVGLKKPITVVRRSEPNADGEQFDLVCGQGRIEAFLALGETTIPAIIVGNAHTPAWVGLLGSLVPGPFGNIDQRILGRSIAAEIALHSREAGEVIRENAAMKKLATVQ